MEDCLQVLKIFIRTQKEFESFSGWVNRAVQGIPKEVAEGTTISMKKVDWLISEMNKESDMRQ